MNESRPTQPARAEESDSPSRPTDETFDLIAENYHEVLDEGLASTGESSDYFARGRITWLSRQLAQLGLRPEQILDFGCGTGSAAPFLCEHLDPTAILGIDVSAATIEVAARTHGTERVHFQHAADYQPDASKDLAYCNGVFHHIPPAERPAAIAVVFESLRSGGVFALWENNPWNPGTRYVMNNCEFDEDAILVFPHEARRLLRNAGFEILRTDYLFIFPKALAALRPLEAFATRLPLGGQYQVLVRKP